MTEISVPLTFTDAAAQKVKKTRRLNYASILPAAVVAASNTALPLTKKSMKVT